MKTSLLAVTVWIILLLAYNQTVAAKTDSKPIWRVLYERLIFVEKKVWVIEQYLGVKDGQLQKKKMGSKER
jgi:hypothetical protein